MTKVSEAVLLFLLNATWQVTLVTLLASAADRMLRDAKARYRHLLGVLALATCLSLSGSVFLRSVPAPIVDSVTAHTRPDHQEQKLLVDGVAPEPASFNRRPEGIRKRWIWIKMPVLRVAKPFAMAALLLYLILLLYRVGRLWRAWRRTRKLLRSALPIKASAELNEALARCELRLDLKHVRVLSSTTVAVPSAARILRPLVILPAHLLAEDDLDLLTSAIGHEAAHIARHDYLMNLIYELVSLPLWFHPAISLLLRRIRQTRELSCDEIVAERLLRPPVYAQSLLQLAAAAVPRSRSSATIAVGIADAEILEERIMSILNHSPLKSRRQRLLCAISALLLVAPCVAAGALAMRVAVRPPAHPAVILQSRTSDNVPAQPSASGQQSSRASETPASTPVEKAQPKAPSDFPERRETVLVVAQQVKSHGPEGDASKAPGSRHDVLQIRPGKDLELAGGPEGGVTGGPEGGVVGGMSGGVAGGVRSNAPQGPQHAKPEHPGIVEGKLIQLIEPVYPQEARAAGIQGDVVFEATIGKTGDIENVRTISGDSSLRDAALDALKQWKYEPYRFNSEPVEVKATITFKFRLAE